MKIKCNDCGEIFWITPEHHLRYNNGGCPNCHNIKILKCSICGKDVYVNKHSTYKTVICDECKNKVKQNNKEQKQKRNIKEQRKQSNKKNFNCNNDVLKKEIVKCPFCGIFHKKGEKCINDLCNQYNSISLLKKFIPFGFDFSKIGTLDYIDEYYKSINLILNEYYDNELSAEDIFNKYNCINYFKSSRTIYNIIVSLGFKPRTLSEAVSLSYKHNDKNMFVNIRKIIKHTSWNGNEYTLRSSYELDFALDLDKKKISYIVEFKRIEYYDT